MIDYHKKLVENRVGEILRINEYNYPTIESQAELDEELKQLREALDNLTASSRIMHRRESFIDFFKWCEKYHFINPTGNYDEVIRQYEKSINDA